MSMVRLSFDQNWIVFKSKVWKTWSEIDAVYFQLTQPFLCMPIPDFEKNLQKYVKLHSFDLKDDAKREKAIHRLIKRNKYTPPIFKDLFPKEVRKMLRSKDGAFEAQDYAFKVLENEKKG